MAHVLNARERKALDALSFDRGVLIPGTVPTGIGAGTMDQLVQLGLAEEAASERHHGTQGWRITPDGWRCMYGATYEELMASKGPHHPFRVWQWPFDPTAARVRG